MHKIAHMLKDMALTIGVAMLAAVLAFDPAIAQKAAATGCSSGGTISDQQQKGLQNLPLGLRSVLEAVRQHKQSACLAPAASGPGMIDPLSVPISFALTSSPSSSPAVPDEVVTLITGDGSNIDTIAQANGLVVRARQPSTLLGGFLVRLGIPDGRTPNAVIASLRANAAVDTPGPNHIYQLQAKVPKPGAEKTSVYEEARFAPKKIGLPDSKLDLTGKGILIGVIDTAVDPDHPDLQGAILDSFDALKDQPINNNRHGTAVAGLIAGRSMIRGIAPRANLLIARAFDEPAKNASGDKAEKASATTYQLLSALDWTVQKKARIINMSFSGPRNPLMSKALTAAAKKNILLIAAAGNNGPKAPAVFPAAEPSVLAVTATDIEDRIYSDANIGRYVFVSAPGVDILAAAPDKGIDMVSGTSFAAPFLSGLAALMLEQNSNMTPREFALIIAKTSQDLGQPGRDEIFGVGLADMSKALSPR